MAESSIIWSSLLILQFVIYYHLQIQPIQAKCFIPYSKGQYLKSFFMDFNHFQTNSIYIRLLVILQ